MEKKATENLGDMFGALGSSMEKIFNDPKLKEKAVELGKAVKESAETFKGRFDDPEVKAKFKEAGQATQSFGKNVSSWFDETIKAFKDDTCPGCGGKCLVVVEGTPHKCPVCNGTGKVK
jgi:ribosomal-protein-alanine N-acetyltransferase